MDSSKQNGSDIARMIWIVGSPIIFTIGVFGNIMTIIVLTNKRNKKTSSSIFLTFLAFADLLMMTMMLPRWWLIYLFGFDVRHLHNTVCKIHFFVSYFGSCYSASLLAAVTIERTICTVKPYRVKAICTVQIATFISVGLALTVCAIHGHILAGMKLYEVNFNETTQTSNNSFPDDTIEKATNICDSVQDHDFKMKNDDLDRFMLEENCGRSFFSSAEGKTDVKLVNFVSVGKTTEARKVKVCWYYDDNYGNYFSGIHQTVATVCYLIIPETIFFVGGLIIARSLQKSRNLRMRMRTEYMSTASNRPAFDSRATQITLTLLLVNIVFVLTTSPAFIFRIGMSSWLDEDTGMTVTQETVWAIVNLMIFFNHSVNFILYFLSGYRFRRQVLETFKCMRQIGAHNSGVSLNQFGTASVSSTYGLNLK